MDETVGVTVDTAISRIQARKMVKLHLKLHGYEPVPWGKAYSTVPEGLFYLEGARIQGSRPPTRGGNWHASLDVDFAFIAARHLFVLHRMWGTEATTKLAESGLNLLEDSLCSEVVRITCTDNGLYQKEFQGEHIDYYAIRKGKNILEPVDRLLKRIDTIMGRHQ